MEKKSYYIVEKYGSHEITVSVEEIWFRDSIDSVRIKCSDSASSIFLDNDENSLGITINDVYNAIVTEFNHAEEFYDDITLTSVPMMKSYFIFFKYGDDTICVKLWVNFISHKASIFCEYDSQIKSVSLSHQDILNSIGASIERAKKCIDSNNLRKNGEFKGFFGPIVEKIYRKRVMKKYPEFFKSNN